MTALETAAAAALEACRAGGVTVVTVESCTGGMICAALTAIPGSSDVVYGGLVTYDNAAKTALVGVPEDLIAEHGAVSAAVVDAMAAGGLARSTAHLSVAVSGIAGPGGGSAAKPVGLVHIAVHARSGAAARERHLFRGDRAAVREQAVLAALRMLKEMTERA